jgi:hypothetical protein
LLLLLSCAQQTVSAVAVNGSKQACSSGLTGDTEFTTCASFCNEDKKTNHCRFCKCRNCPYCPAVLEVNTAKGKHTPCSTDLTGDFTYRACAAFCKTGRSSSHCAWCKCADCPFCLAKPNQAGEPDIGGEENFIGGVGGRPARLHAKKHGGVAPLVASAGGAADAGQAGAQGKGSPPGMLLFYGAVSFWLIVVLHSVWKTIGSRLLFGDSPDSLTAASPK